MKTAGEVHDFFINSKLVNQNVFLFIFGFNQKLIPLFRSEKKGRITDHFRTLLCEILNNVSAIVFTNQNFIKIGKQFFVFLLVFFWRKILADTCSIAAFLFSFFYKIKEIGGIKIGKLVIPDLVTSCDVNVVFACYRLHFTLSDRLAVTHVLTEFVAFETAGNVADMADRPVNIVKKSLLFQVYKTERIADIVAAVINNFRLSADFPQFFLERIALQDGTVIVVVMEGNHTYSFFLHKVLLANIR